MKFVQVISNIKLKKKQLLTYNRFLIIGITLLNMPCLYSQVKDKQNEVFQISGGATDSITNQPISFYSVSLLHQPGNQFVKGTTASENGEFNFKELLPGNYTIRMSSIGYGDKFCSINIDGTKSVIKLNLVLKPIQIELKEVVVHADMPLYKQEADKKVYMVANDSIIQTAFGVDALQNAPGVDVDLSGAITLLGASASIWINGKPTRKDGLMLKNYLEQLPASTIEKIEVISNPSAKYTATNTQGIINIVLKKNLTYNYFFCLGTVISNNHPVYGLWTSYVYNTPKLNLNLRYLTSSVHNLQSDFSESWSQNNQDTTFYNLFDQKIMAHSFDHQLDAEINYNLSAKTTISINSDEYWSKNDDKTDNNLLRKYNNPDEVETSISNGYTSTYINNTVVFNHVFNDKGHNLSINITNAISEIDATKTINQSSFSLEQNTTRNSHQNTKDLYTTLNLDYILPFNDRYEFETGFTYNPFISNKDNRQVDTLSNLVGVTNNCDLLNKNISTCSSSFETFFTFGGSLAKVKYKIGCRYEHSNAGITSTIPEFTLNRTFQSFYPSVHLSYETEKKHSFSMSYSRRVNKPTNELNPYIDRFEETNINMGNPDLNLAKTNSFEIGYLKDFKRKVQINSTIYHRITKNDITMVYDTSYDAFYRHSVIIQKYENIATTNFSGLSTDVSYQMNKKLRLKISGNLFYREIESNYKNDLFSEKSISYTLKGTISWKPFKNHQIMLRSNFKSDDKQLFSKTKNTLTFSIYTRSDFFDNRLNIAFVVRDLFIKSQSIKTYDDPVLHSYSKKVYVAPIIQFTALWKIGDKKFEQQAKVNGFLNQN
jgi:hypothetical protein